MIATLDATIRSSVIEFIQPNTKHIYIGYSGGLDSSVLLHVIANSDFLKQHNIEISAVHVNHKLHKDSSTWVQHCKEFADSLQINFDIHTVKEDVPINNIEAWAREQRYEGFNQVMTQPADLLLTAHHQQDQSETLLLRLLRGAGVTGLSAMQACRQFANGLHIRPLLTISKTQLHEYAKAHKLQWIEDSSNDDLHFSRNYLRHKLMPVLQKKWPMANSMLARSAELLQESDKLLESYAALLLEKVLNKTFHALYIAKLKQFDNATRKLILKHWLSSQYNLQLTYKNFAYIENHILAAQVDAEPLLQIGNMQLRRYQNHLYCVPLTTETFAYNIKWNGEKALQVPGYNETLTKEYLQAQGLNIAKLDWYDIQVCSRKHFTQARCQPYDRAHSQTLKKCLQEAGVPAWLRYHLPVICNGDEICMVVDAFVCKGYNAQKLN
ncbi:MAG: tRNA lysidine(34) synthetase TilS [Thiotrichales bacterium]|nr:MAG: tRNA lysidine(34) synthetase TilS [Thiotrichales bacterium]